MHVRTGQLPRALLTEDLAYRRLGDERMPLLGCGTIVHVPGRMGLGRYCFEHAASAVLLLRGGGWYRDGADGADRRLAPGDLFLRLPGRIHESRPDDDGRWLEFFLHVPRSLWDAAVAGGLLAGAGMVWHPGLHADLLRQFIDLRERMRDPLRHPTCAILGRMLALLADLRARHDAGTTAAADPLARAEVLLRARFDRPLPATAVASQVGLPWETFRKAFRRRTGLSPAAYRQQARMRHAAVLLGDRHLGIKGVAAMVGYADGFAFSKAYRRWSGAAPSRGRENEKT